LKSTIRNENDDANYILNTMERDWKIITSELYNKIKPIGGNLFCRVGTEFLRTGKVSDVWVEFEMNDFMYNDPFYGLQKSTAPFRMNFALWDFLLDYKINSTLELEGKVFNGEGNKLIGAFSNSLHFMVPEVKFGKIDDLNYIDLELKYSLTNSASYGMMTETINEHKSKYGTISVKLKIKELLFIVQTGWNPETILKQINTEYYDITRYYKVTESPWVEQNYDAFYVPFKKQ